MGSCHLMKTLKRYIEKLRLWLGTLSFRTGVICGCVCVTCYVLSFAQMLLPISVAAKGVLWAVFYGLAKASQYSAIFILGKKGLERVRGYLRRA